MEQCLVTQLKGVADNPNLPVLETMQQFTLDAIALSGNVGMSENKKLALNHFFYQIGAISNNETWQKVKFLFMPMICGDNVATAMNDYVSNTVIAADATPTFVNHGLRYTGGAPSQVIGTDVFSGSSFDLSVFVATMKESLANNNVQVLLDKGDTSQRRIFNSAKKGAGDYYAIGAPGVTLQTPNVSELIFDAGYVVNGASECFGSIMSSQTGVIINKKATAQQFNNRSAEIVYSNNYLRMNMGVETDFGLAMIADAMSQAEADTVLKAIAALKTAFSAS